MKGLAVITSIACAAFVCPGLVMLYLTVFGASFSSEQALAAYLLLLPGIGAGGMAAYCWGEVTR